MYFLVRLKFSFLYPMPFLKEKIGVEEKIGVVSTVYILRAFYFNCDIHISQDEVDLKTRACAPISNVEIRIAICLISFELH